MRISRWFAAGAAGLALAAWTPGAGAEEARGAEAERSGAEAGAQDADDTGRNVRDRDERTLTPMDQSNAEQDLETTRRIREAITSDDSLSLDARNVKIITQGGTVTLRGPVGSEDEKRTVERLAEQHAGDMRVDSQLEVEREARTTGTQSEE